MELPASDQNIWLTAMVGFAVKLLASVLWTQHEAKSIGLIIDAHSQPQDKVWGSVDGSKVLLGCILEKFQGAKNGELLYDLVPWNEVPLSFRRKINGFVVTMEDMKTNGHLTADRARLRQLMERMGTSVELIEKVESLCNE